MANKIEMAFKKGDQQIHYFQIPVDSWFPGSVLWFAAKQIVDNDNTDGAAVINKSFTDLDIVDNTHDMYDGQYKTYELEFVPGDTSSVTFANGAKFNKYLGEFQLVSPTGEPESYPSDDSFIEVKVYADIKRGTS